MNWRTRRVGEAEQKACAGEKDEQDGADLADDQLGEWLDVRTLVAVGSGVLDLELLRDAGHVGLCGVEGNAILETPDGEEIVAAAAFFAGAELVNSGPELCVAAWSEVKAFREDADDGGWCTA